MAKKEKQVEPQYYVSATGIQTYNYKVYDMPFIEKVICFILAFIVGAAVGYLFYGGIGKDEFGNSTTITYVLNVVISSIVGCVAGIIFVPVRREQKIKKQQKDLRLQFREMLESVSTSIGSGKNVIDSFKSAYDDMRLIYEEDAFIVQELKVILNDFNHNVNVEVALYDFAARSGLDDIQNFAEVFDTCYKVGGNIKDVIKGTHNIISEKIEIELDIQTTVAGAKSEQTTMMIMPILLIGIIKISSPEFGSNFTTATGVISTTIAVILFVIAYFVAKTILNIKV